MQRQSSSWPRSLESVAPQRGPSSRSQQAGIGGRISVKRLQHLRNQHSASEQYEEEGEVKDVGNGEVALFEELYLYHRILITPFMNSSRNKRSHGNGQHDEDEVAFQPVFTLSFIENNLQRAKPDRDQRYSNVVNAQL